MPANQVDELHVCVNIQGGSARNDWVWMDGCLA